MIVVNNAGGFGALGGPKPQFSGLFVTPMRAWGGGGEGGARASILRPLLLFPCRPWGGGGGGGRGAAVTERPWLWSLGLRFRAWGWGLEWFRGRFVGS